MDENEVIELLTNNQFIIMAYYGYDTGYLTSNVLLKADEPTEPLYPQINRVHLQARKHFGLNPHVDNKSAVKVVLLGHPDPVYLCVYDYERTVCTAIVRRLGAEYTDSK